MTKGVFKICNISQRKRPRTAKPPALRQVMTDVGAYGGRRLKLDLRMNPSCNYFLSPGNTEWVIMSFVNIECSGEWVMLVVEGKYNVVRPEIATSVFVCVSESLLRPIHERNRKRKFSLRICHLLPPANEVWDKVIFLHLFVILFTGGHAWLLGGMCGCWGVCVVASGGGHVWLPVGGHAWLLEGMHGCFGRVWLLGGVCGCWGHAWLLGGVWFARGCVVAGMDDYIDNWDNPIFSPWLVGQWPWIFSNEVYLHKNIDSPSEGPNNKGTWLNELISISTTSLRAKCSDKFNYSS